MEAAESSEDEAAKAKLNTEHGGCTRCSLTEVCLGRLDSDKNMVTDTSVAEELAKTMLPEIAELLGKLESRVMQEMKVLKASWQSTASRQKRTASKSSARSGSPSKRTRSPSPDSSNRAGQFMPAATRASRIGEPPPFYEHQRSMSCPNTSYPQTLLGIHPHSVLGSSKTGIARDPKPKNPGKVAPIRTVDKDDKASLPRGSFCVKGSRDCSESNTSILSLSDLRSDHHMSLEVITRKLDDVYIQDRRHYKQQTHGDPLVRHPLTLSRGASGSSNMFAVTPSNRHSFTSESNHGTYSDRCAAFEQEFASSGSVGPSTTSPDFVPSLSGWTRGTAVTDEEQIPAIAVRETNSNDTSRTSSFFSSATKRASASPLKVIKEFFALRGSSFSGTPTNFLSTSASQRRSFTLKAMRQTRQDELVASVLPSSSNELKASSPLWLHLVGVLPMSSFDGTRFISRLCRNTNRMAMLSLVISVIVTCIYQLVAVDNSCSMSFCLKDLLSPVLALAIGCFLRVASFFLLGDDEFNSEVTLATHLESISTADVWSTRSSTIMVKVWCCWVCVLGLCVYCALDWNVAAAKVIISLAIIGFTTQVFMALAFSMMRACEGLSLAIDNYCVTIAMNNTCEHAVEDWSILQAIIRRVCTTVGRTFIILLTSCLEAIFLPAMLSSSFTAITILPGVLTFFVLLWVSLFIGGVTSKCDRVPSFVNMMDFGESFDEKRQYVVDYISNSRAGFYLFDVRVTGEMVVKSFYVLCMLGALFTTRVLSSQEND